MIRIDAIAHKDQRYPTVGDWAFKNGDLQILVSDTGVMDYNFLVALHEMIEAYLCKKTNISSAMVDEWDKSFPNEFDPGSLQHCPYRDQHKLAEAVERLVAHELNVDWKAYEETLRGL